MKKPSVWELHGERITEMRRACYTLQEIGDSVGVSRERIRQLLKDHNVSFENPLLSESAVSRLLGCSISRLMKLRKAGFIKPAKQGKLSYSYDRAELQNIQSALQEQSLRTK